MRGKTGLLNSNLAQTVEIFALLKSNKGKPVNNSAQQGHAVRICWRAVVVALRK